MTHLTEAEFVDLVDATLEPSREAHVIAHLRACEECRAVAVRMREAMSRAAAVDMPEPSPLFWEHFSARVHEGVREAESGAASTWFRWVRGETLTWAMSGALLTFLLVAGVWMSMWRADVPAPTDRATTAATTPIADAASDRDVDAFDPDTDQAWALVRTVADDVSWDDAEAVGVGARPGSAERAMATLTVDERSELVRLLQAETKQPGA
jgi:hypothetical protein